jgi:hypothetical protein
MHKIILALGLALFAAGGVEAYKTADFQSHATEVVGSVIGVQELRGPPKPRQKTPLFVSYRREDGSEVQTVTHLPMLQQIEQGDSIRLLVDPRNPQDARLPLWSELWARPLTYCIGGLLLVIVARVLGTKRSR